MFENRLFFVDKLVAMGARITLCDPHRAIVSGPSRLHGERLESPDIRAGMAMLIAALAADGTSEIGNIVQIDRGYEKIDARLRDLGARIERVSSERVPPERAPPQTVWCTSRLWSSWMSGWGGAPAHHRFHGGASRSPNAANFRRLPDVNDAHRAVHSVAVWTTSPSGGSSPSASFTWSY